VEDGMARITPWFSVCLIIVAGILLTTYTAPHSVLFEGALKSVAGDAVEPVYGAVETAWGQILAGRYGILFWGYLLIGFGISYFLYYSEKRGKAPVSSSLASTGERRPPPSTYRSFLFPNGFLNNGRVRLDLFFFITSGVLATFAGFFLTIVTGDALEGAVKNALSSVFESPAIKPTVPIRIVGSIVVVLAMDLQHYALHYWLHNTKLGWSLHQTHHSQTQLNVFSDDREHPLYLMLDAAVPGIFVAAPLGLLNFLVPGFFELELGHLGIGYALFMMTKVFRHSHVVIRFPRPLEWLIQSPAFHVVHHSSLPEHMNKNIGNFTTVWDRLFGTLYVPKPGESYQFGTGEQEADEAHTKLGYIYGEQTKTILRNLVRVLFSPFVFISGFLMPVSRKH
jgi:sterol desaturase/sphingolipid hydroxylase (fatty acid hydroxylase superfamily)